MADKEYRFWAFDLVTKTPLGQVPMGTVTATATLNTPGQLQGNLYPSQALGLKARTSYSDAIGTVGTEFASAVLDRIMTATTPGKTFIVPEWNGFPVGAWKVEKRIYNSSSANQPAYWQIQGSELLNHFNIRTYRGATGAPTDAINSGLTPVPVNVDMVTGTLQALLSYSNDIGLDLSGLQAAGFIDSESYDPTMRDPILTLINDLVQQDVGPDIWIQCTWQSPGVRIPQLKVLASQHLGRLYTDNINATPRIRYPYDVISYTVTEDGTQSYSVVDELSRDQNGNVEIATATNPQLVTNGWPETDFAFNRDGGTALSISQSTLQQWANGDASLFNGPVKIGSFIVRPEAAVGLINPGDEIRVSITDYPMPWGQDLYQRVIGLMYDFDNRQVTLQIDGSTGWQFSDTARNTYTNYNPVQNP